MMRRCLVVSIGLCLCLWLAAWANPALNNLVIGGTQEPSNLCPWEGYAAVKENVLGLLNIALTYFSSDGVLHPGLATEIPTEENGRLKLFRDADGKVIRQEVLWTLREDAYWSDGRTITSDDAVFTFKVQNTPEIPVTSRAFSNLVEEVRKVDNRSFWIVYRSPNLFYAHPGGSIGLCPWFDIAPKHVWQPIYNQVMEQIRANPENAQAIIEGQFLGAPPSTGTGLVVGSGAFQFQEWQVNQLVRVRRRADFFLDPPGPVGNYIQEVTYRFIVSQPTLLSAILAGEVDASDTIGLAGMDPAILAARLGDGGTIEVVADGY
ncbi:ABC transporter substrate-binding protein, partial [Candidatus Bipolaricaulota bacterium]